MKRSMPSMAVRSAPMSMVRARFAWTYSTAGIRRLWRNTLGHAFSIWRTSSSSRPLRVSSSNAAAASTLSMKLSAPVGIFSGSSIGIGFTPSERSASTAFQS